MEVKIYLIEDCDSLKYVGSTTQTLNSRLSQHKTHKRIGKTVSSCKLNLNDSVITELERCDESNRNEREQYWIDRIDCVNQINAIHDQKQYNKEYLEKNREQIKEKKREHRENNKEQIKEYMKQYRKLDWFCSDCKCNVKKHHKSRHLKTKKHQLNIE